MTTYTYRGPAREIRRYTVGVLRSNAAYAADRAVAAGFCAVCLEYPRAGHARRCTSCQGSRRYEVTR